jgi:hypothetical protein
MLVGQDGTGIHIGISHEVRARAYPGEQGYPY